MRNESVAILDIRSYEVTFMLGSKGVNDTFVFYGSHTEKYEGFSTEGFLTKTPLKTRCIPPSIPSVKTIVGK